MCTIVSTQCNPKEHPKSSQNVIKKMQYIRSIILHYMFLSFSRTVRRDADARSKWIDSMSSEKCIDYLKQIPKQHANVFTRS